MEGSIAQRNKGYFWADNSDSIPPSTFISTGGVGAPLLDVGIYSILGLLKQSSVHSRCVFFAFSRGTLAGFNITRAWRVMMVAYRARASLTYFREAGSLSKRRPMWTRYRGVSRFVWQMQLRGSYVGEEITSWMASKRETSFLEDKVSLIALSSIRVRSEAGTLISGGI